MVTFKILTSVGVGRVRVRAEVTRYRLAGHAPSAEARPAVGGVRFETKEGAERRSMCSPAHRLLTRAVLNWWSASGLGPQNR